MSEIDQSNTATTSMSIKDDAAKTNALIAYAMMVAGLFTGVLWIVGAVWAMVKKDEAKGTLFEDHYINITSTFWWGLGIWIIGFITVFFVVGYFILLGVWVWSIYRVIKGLARITSNKAFNS